MNGRIWGKDSEILAFSPNKSMYHFVSSPQIVSVFVGLKRDSQYFCGMKTNITVFLCVFVLFLSCKQQPTVHPILLQVDSLCQESPREALKILDSIEDSQLLNREYDIRKSQLLRIKAHDKAWDIAENDSLNSILVSYFEQNGSPNDILESYYYLAGAYRDLHDTPKAFHWYLKAAEYGEQHIEYISKEVLSCIFAQLARMAHRLHYDQKALEMAKQEYFYSSDSTYNPQTSMDLAIHYDMQKIDDSTHLFYKKAFKIINKKQEWERFLDIIAVQLSHYSMEGNRLNADTCMAIIRSYPQSWSFDNVAWSRAIYFLHFGPADSAIVYFRDALHYSRETGRKANAAHNLIRLFQESGQVDSLAKYGVVYSALQDSFYAEQKREVAADVLNEFRYRRDKEAEEAAYRQALETKATGWMVMSLSLLALTTALGGFWLYRKYVKGIMAKRSEELAATQAKLAQAKEQWENEMQLRTVMRVSSSDVNRLLKDIAHHPGAEMDEAHWQQAFAAVDAADPAFSSRLKTALPDISAKDIKLVYLLKLNLSQEEIATLLGYKRITIHRHISLLETQAGQPLWKV